MCWWDARPVPAVPCQCSLRRCRAPYSNDTTGKTPMGVRTFSKGIVKGVSLAFIEAGSAALSNVAVRVSYAGPYPTVR